jgi:hypothetical protein
VAETEVLVVQGTLVHTSMLQVLNMNMDRKNTIPKESVLAVALGLAYMKTACS